ncbi:LuxR C-terminal-related transcriptional regulator [Jeongeupia wiesaeckerbachi]
MATLAATLSSCRVLVLHAPAGFGKSCALLQLYHALGPEQCQWLALEPGDRRPAHATRSVLAQIGGHADRPLLLFVDALERLPAACEGRWLRAVLDVLPPSVTLVLATRCFTPHALEHLRMAGALVEVGPSTLRMGWDEVMQLCRGAPMPSHAEISRWERATGGWPAILALLRLSLDAGEASAGDVLNSAVFHRRVGRYLDDEVLASGSDDDRRLLAGIAPLGDASAPLCDALYGRDDSTLRLAQLVQHGLPVDALGDARYRVHPVLVAYAPALTHAQPLPALVQWRRRAADWFIAQGEVEAAVGQLLAAQAWDEVMHYLPALAQSLLFRAHFQQVVDWCEALPPARLRADIGLSVTYVWGLFFGGAAQRALHVLSEMKTNMRGMCDPLVEQTINLQELVLTEYLQPDYTVILQGIGALMPMLESVGDMNRGRIYNLLAMIQISQGELAEAATSVVQAKRIHREVGNQQGLFTSHFLEAAMLASGGDLQQALDVLGNADDMLRQRDARTLAGSMHVFCVGYRLQLMYELGQYGLARDWLDRYQRLQKGSPSVLSTLLAGLIDARLTLFDKGAGPALLVLERLADRFGQDRAVQRRIGFEMARIAIVTQDALRLRAFVADLLDDADWPDTPVFVHPSEELEGAGVEVLRLMLHAGEQYRARAMQRLELLLADTALIGRSWRRMKLLLLLAVGHLCSGQRDRAINTLREALQLAAVNGTVSSFLDEGAALIALLASLRTHGGILTATELAHADRILSARGQTSPPVSGVALSERELEILRLVAEGLTNEQVAERLCLAMQTVKWYLSGIYAKLGVGNRVGAVDKCRRLGQL